MFVNYDYETAENYITNMKKLLTLIPIIFIISCGENLIEKVKEKYDNGKLKLVHYYKKVDDNQELVSIKKYNEN